MDGVLLISLFVWSLSLGGTGSSLECCGGLQVAMHCLLLFLPIWGDTLFLSDLVGFMKKGFVFPWKSVVVLEGIHCLWDEQTLLPSLVSSLAWVSFACFPCSLGSFLVLGCYFVLMECLFVVIKEFLSSMLAFLFVLWGWNYLLLIYRHG